jgi:hypothetical protein
MWKKAVVDNVSVPHPVLLNAAITPELYGSG